MFGRRYSLWRAGLPVDIGPVLTFEGNCSYFRANPAHLVRHLPPVKHVVFGDEPVPLEPLHALAAILYDFVAGIVVHAFHEFDRI